MHGLGADGRAAQVPALTVHVQDHGVGEGRLVHAAFDGDEAGFGPVLGHGNKAALGVDGHVAGNRDIGELIKVDFAAV